MENNDYEMEETEQDRLSELPLSLIFHIFSYLPMRGVISTTLLSKRWKGLWRTVPCLNFCHWLEKENEENIRNFVNRTLMLWKGTKIMKFQIDLDFSLEKDMDLWVSFVKEYGVEELNLHFMDIDHIVDGDNDVVAPQSLNSCPSIKTLSLVGCNLQLERSPHWNQLKSLTIDGFYFSEGVINRVLSGAPQLEVFVLRLLENNENLNIQSKSLKKLKIQKYCNFDYYYIIEGNDEDPPANSVLRIGCPNLETLEISGLLYSKCVLTSASSVTDATLMFDGSQYYDLRGLPGKELLAETLRQIFFSIRRVEKATLSSWCVQALGSSQKLYLLSPLSNVTFLEVHVCSIKLDRMVHLLGIFPNVKKLAINVLYGNAFIGFEMDLPNYNLLQLRTIEVTSHTFLTRIFPLIEFLLKYASMLERMVIRVHELKSLSKRQLLNAAERLLSIPRSSPTAKVFFREK